MGWRLTWRFLLSIIAVLVIVMMINVVTIIIGITDIARESNIGREIFGQGVSPVDLTRNFHQYILEEDEKIYVSETGKKIIDGENLWIQILNENGEEIYNYNAPKEVIKNYTPYEIVHIYKYGGVMGKSFNMFVSEKIIENNRYSYVIAFPFNKVNKMVLTYTDEGFIRGIKIFTVASVTGNVIVAVIFGYLLSLRLTRPMERIMKYINRLRNGDYSLHVKPEGVYKEVHMNVNDLANTLKESSLERKRSEKMREEWIANISHDIKTPLSSIKGYAEMLKDDYDITLEEVKEYAEVIEMKSDHINNLVEDLNLSSKLKHNKAFVKREKDDLNRLLKETVISILNDSMYRERDISFHSCDEMVEYEFDGKLLRRAVENLIYNALIHNSSNVKVDISLKSSEKNIEISIKDNGIGMSKDEAENIFSRYYRGTNTLSQKGSGLGMAIAKEVVEANGGTIEVTTNMGDGTEIIIHFIRG